MFLRRMVSRLLGRHDGKSMGGSSQPPVAASKLDMPVGEIEDYLRMQRQGCIAIDGASAWRSVSHDSAARVLTDSVSFSSCPQAEFDPVLLGADPPAHQRARKLLSLHLNSKAGAALERGASVARTLLAPHLEIVSGYSAPVARAFAARIIGLCERSFKDLLASVLETREVSERPLPMETVAIARRSELYEALCRELEDWEAISLVGLVATASTETVERLIARCVLVLLRDQPLRAELVDRPSELVRFIDEVLRLFPPEPTLVREARRDVVLDGLDIPAGAKLSVSVASANRDPTFYKDPQRIRLDLAERQHFSFGAGVHQCVGAGYARRLCFSALDILLKEAPDFRSPEPISEACLANVGGRLLPKELWIHLPSLQSQQDS